MDSDLSRAVELLKQGLPVSIPTETVYGLAAAIDNPQAVEQVFRLKERPFFDPLIVHISDPQEINSLVLDVPPAAWLLINNFWPGPLTLVLPRRDCINQMICSGLDTVAVRCPAHPLARAVIEGVGVPIAAPSANRFGRTSPTRAEHVKSEWPNGEVFVLDGGECSLGVESTVVRVEEKVEGTLVALLRPGSVTTEMLRSALISSPRPCTVERIASVASPGSCEHHYMPTIPLVVVNRGTVPLDKTKVEDLSGRLGVAAVCEYMPLSQDPVIVARQLYSSMREAAETGAAFIVCEAPPSAEGVWEAISDRLKRAATYWE